VLGRVLKLSKFNRNQYNELNVNWDFENSLRNKNVENFPTKNKKKNLKIYVGLESKKDVEEN
jgi:hypothetical protein